MSPQPLRIRRLVPLAVTVAVLAGVGACGRAPAGRPASAASAAGWAGAPAAAASTSAAPPAAAVPSPSPSPVAVRYVFPVRGTVSYGHTHHDYPATDVLARCGSPVVAVTSGTVLEVTTVDRYVARVHAGPTRGGLSVSILGDDGVRYYGSHFAGIEAGVVPGKRVAAGDPLGRVGRTGDASACHLHFGISPPCRRTGDWWIQRGMIWPWPYLDSWRAGGRRSAVAEIAGLGAKGCPAHPLSDP